MYDIVYKLISPIVDSYKDHYPTSKERHFPYSEFKFSAITPNNYYSDYYLLQIDVWDNKGNDIQEIEQIVSNLYVNLNRQLIKTDDLFMQINENAPCVLNLVDPMDNIQRRQLKFLCKVYPNML